MLVADPEVGGNSMTNILLVGPFNIQDPEGGCEREPKHRPTDASFVSEHGHQSLVIA